MAGALQSYEAGAFHPTREGDARRAADASQLFNRSRRADLVDDRDMAYQMLRRVPMTRTTLAAPMTMAAIAIAAGKPIADAVDA